MIKIAAPEMDTSTVIPSLEATNGPSSYLHSCQEVLATQALVTGYKQSTESAGSVLAQCLGAADFEAGGRERG